MRTTVPGRADFQLTLRVMRQNAALEIKPTRRFFRRVAARTRRRSGSGLAVLPESFASSGITSW